MNEKELELFQMLEEKDKTIEKLRADLNEKEIFIKSLQEKIIRLEGFRVCGDDEESLNFFHDNENVSDNHLENPRKKLKKEAAQLNRAEIISPSNTFSEALNKVLRNPMVLTKILRKMRTLHLLQNCRLVSREWRDLSTDILLKRKNNRVAFEREYESTEFVLKRDKTLKLNQLTNFLSSFKTQSQNQNERFPCSNFSFQGDLNCKDSQDFLSSFGTSIKGLELVENADLDSLRKLFVEQVPNLQRLKMRDIYVENEGDFFPENSNFNSNSPKPEQKPTPVFSSLTSLKLWAVQNFSVVKGIVEAAPNLQECRGGWSVEEFQLLYPQIHRLKHLELWSLPEDFKTLEKLSETEKVQLESCHIDIFHPHPDPIQRQLQYQFDNPNEEQIELDTVSLIEFDRILSKLLSSNQVSLKKLKMTPSAHFDSLIQWPVLKNVKKLTLIGDSSDGLKIPPFKISKHFPALQTLRLTNTTNDMENIELFKDFAPSVRSVFISGAFVNTVEQFYPTFPNIQQLSLKDVQLKGFQTIAPIIWKMEGLKSLQLQFQGCLPKETGLDSLFTGMEPFTCDFLRSCGGGKMDDFDMEKVRVKPSILNLTELEQLDLSQDCGKKHLYEKNPHPVATSQETLFISFEYAFKLLPKLHVNFL